MNILVVNWSQVIKLGLSKRIYVVTLRKHKVSLLNIIKLFVKKINN